MTASSCAASITEDPSWRRASNEPKDALTYYCRKAKETTGRIDHARSARCIPLFISVGLVALLAVLLVTGPALAQRRQEPQLFDARAAADAHRAQPPRRRANRRQDLRRRRPRRLDLHHRPVRRCPRRGTASRSPRSAAGSTR